MKCDDHELLDSFFVLLLVTKPQEENILNIWNSWDKLPVKALMMVIIAFVYFVSPFITGQRNHSQTLSFPPCHLTIMSIFPVDKRSSFPCHGYGSLSLNVQAHLDKFLLYCLNLYLPKYISL